MSTHAHNRALHAEPDGLPSGELFRQSEGGLGYRVDRAGALLGLVGGPTAGLLGAVLLVIGYFGGDPHRFHTLTDVGTWLLYSFVPLLVVGAHFLDRLEDRLNARAVGFVRARRHLRPVQGIGGAIVICMLAGAGSTASAQQTIFNVPSTDVLDDAKVYVELDVTWKPVDPKFSSVVPRVVVGTGGRVEVGLNITGNIQPGDDVTTIQPAFKWKAYDGGDNGWAVAIGDNISVPVRNKPYDVGNYAYAEVSKRFDTGTRITAGGYHFSEDVVAPAQRAGGQFGVEQTVTSWLNVNADWFTGRHASGYFTPGIAFKPHPKVTGYIGYSVGNTGASDGNHFVYTAVGVNFN